MTAEDVKKRAHAAGKKVETKVKAAKQKVSKTVHHVHNVLSDEELSDRARAQFLELYEEHEGTLEAATAFIQDRPYLSVALGILAGLIFGRIFCRSK